MEEKEHDKQIQITSTNDGNDLDKAFVWETNFGMMGLSRCETPWPTTRHKYCFRYKLPSVIISHWFIQRRQTTNDINYWWFFLRWVNLLGYLRNLVSIAYHREHQNICNGDWKMSHSKGGIEIVSNEGINHRHQFQYLRR